MELVCMGLNNREIAHVLLISFSSAKQAVPSAVRKLGANNRIHAAAIYAQRKAEELW
jgi:DNA-binding NarL/FixJ family response regulator